MYLSIHFVKIIFNCFRDNNLIELVAQLIPLFEK